MNCSLMNALSVYAIRRRGCFSDGFHINNNKRMCVCARWRCLSSLPPEQQESLITPHREEEAHDRDHEGLLPLGEHSEQSW